MADKLKEITKKNCDDSEFLGYDAIFEDPECFYLYNGDDGNTIWDTLETINKKLAPYGLGFASGCDDDYGFAKLFRIKE